MEVFREYLFFNKNKATVFSTKKNMKTKEYTTTTGMDNVIVKMFSMI